MSRGEGTWRFPRAVVIAGLLACLHAAPARAAPSVTIDSGPEGPTNLPAPTFGFTVTDATTVECAIDPAGELNPVFTPCADSYTEGALGDGDWTFHLRATDAVPEITQVSRDFTVDTQAPTVTLDPGGPTGPTNDAEPGFSWTATGDDASARECSLDTGTPDFGPCTTPTQYDQSTPLDEGSYTFRIRTEDEAGNTASDTRTFTVDLTPPTVNLSGGPTGATNNPRPTFVWETAANNARACSVDQGIADFGPCSAFNQHSPPARLTDGAYFFRIRVTDPAGNADVATRDFSVDTTGPAADVTGSRRTGNRRPIFQVSSPEPGATLTCKLDGRPRVRCGPTFTPEGKLKPGLHTLRVNALDALENRGPPAIFEFRILKPPLQAGRAERTVARALRRHKFANRVLANREQSCTRRGRFRFSCRFSSAFPGYELNGRGPVELQSGRISYRFRVRAQGRTMILTDENEGRFPR